MSQDQLTLKIPYSEVIKMREDILNTSFIVKENSKHIAKNTEHIEKILEDREESVRLEIENKEKLNVVVKIVYGTATAVGLAVIAALMSLILK